MSSSDGRVSNLKNIWEQRSNSATKSNVRPTHSPTVANNSIPTSSNTPNKPLVTDRSTRNSLRKQHAIPTVQAVLEKQKSTDDSDDDYYSDTEVYTEVNDDLISQQVFSIPADDDWIPKVDETYSIEYQEIEQNEEEQGEEDDMVDYVADDFTENYAPESVLSQRLEVFGVSLEERAEYDQTEVPLLLLAVLTILEQRVYECMFNN